MQKGKILQCNKHFLAMWTSQCAITSPATLTTTDLLLDLRFVSLTIIRLGLWQGDRQAMKKETRTAKLLSQASDTKLNSL